MNCAPFDLFPEDFAPPWEVLMQDIGQHELIPMLFPRDVSNPRRSTTVTAHDIVGTIDGDIDVGVSPRSSEISSQTPWRSTHDDESLPEKRTEEVKHMLRSILAKRMFNEVSPTDETLSILISVVAGATEAVSEAHIVTPPPLGSASASSSSDKEEEQTEHDLSSHIDVPVSVVEHAPVEEVDVVTTAEEVTTPTVLGDTNNNAVSRPRGFASLFTRPEYDEDEEERNNRRLRDAEQRRQRQANREAIQTNRPSNSPTNGSSIVGRRSGDGHQSD